MCERLVFANKIIFYGFFWSKYLVLISFLFIYCFLFDSHSNRLFLRSKINSFLQKHSKFFETKTPKKFPTFPTFFRICILLFFSSFIQFKNWSKFHFYRLIFHYFISFRRRRKILEKWNLFLNEDAEDLPI